MLVAPKIDICDETLGQFPAVCGDKAKYFSLNMITNHNLVVNLNVTMTETQRCHNKKNENEPKKLYEEM